MAGTMIRFGATLVDELGTSATTTAYIDGDDGQTLAAANTAAQAWAAALDGASSAKLTGLRVTVLPGLPGGIKAAPLAGSRVEQSAVINMAAGASGHRFGNLIPAIKDSLLVGGKLLLSDAAITTFTGLLRGAVLAGTYATPGGNSLGAVIDAVISFRKHRKSLSRTSFEL